MRITRARQRVTSQVVGTIALTDCNSGWGVTPAGLGDVQRGGGVCQVRPVENFVLQRDSAQ